MPSDGDRNGIGASRGKNFGTQTAEGRGGLLMQKELTGLEANVVGEARPELWSFPAIPVTGQRQGWVSGQVRLVPSPSHPPSKPTTCIQMPSKILPGASSALSSSDSLLVWQLHHPPRVETSPQPLQALLAAGTCSFWSIFGIFWGCPSYRKGPEGPGCRSSGSGWGVSCFFCSVSTMIPSLCPCSQLSSVPTALEEIFLCKWTAREKVFTDSLQFGTGIPPRARLMMPLGSPWICPYVISKPFFFLNTSWLCYFLKGAQLTKSMGKGTNLLLNAIWPPNNF